MTVPRYCAIRDLSFRFDKAVGSEYLLRQIVGASPSGEAEPRIDRLDDRRLRDRALLQLLHHPLDAPLLPPCSAFSASEEGGQNVERAALFAVKAGVRAEADVEQHKADGRGDADADAEGNGLNDLFADGEKREDDEENALDKDDAHCGGSFRWFWNYFGRRNA